VKDLVFINKKSIATAILWIACHLVVDTGEVARGKFTFWIQWTRHCFSVIVEILEVMNWNWLPMNGQCTKGLCSHSQF